MKAKMTLRDFLKKYKDDEACLKTIFKLKYPTGKGHCEKCDKERTFYRVEGRNEWQCRAGHQFSPLKGTIFEKSTTPLQYWFYAMFIISNTRSGVSAKQLERELGVTYKTAWRMFKQIRLLMAQDGTPLTGVVEVDETFIGGKGKNRRYEPHFSEKPKEVVMGMVQREGRAYLKHVPNTGKWTLINQIKDNVDSTARVITDEFGSYKSLEKHGYSHDVINHKESYVNGFVHTNNAENMWSQVKRGIYGVYRKVSKKYLQAYIDEYGFRYSNRNSEVHMFDLLLNEVIRTRQF